MSLRIIGVPLAALMRKFLIPQKRPADFNIGPTPEDPYMRRWWLVPRNQKRPNLYLHQILHDDDDRALHDHPAKSLSLMLKGSLIETYQTVPGGETKTRVVKAGDFIYRSEVFAHRLALPEGETECWTLFGFWFKIRTWGFHCPKGWIPWTEFVDSDHPGSPGRGCGEDDRPETAIYMSMVEDHDDVMSIADYLSNVKGGGFIDDDGYGLPIRGNYYAVGHPIHPSSAGSDIPRDATHILWAGK